MNNEFDNPYLDDPIQDEFNKEAAKNPYIQDEIVEQQEQRAVYNLSVDQGAQIQPERSAEVLKISREKNVPAFFVEKNYDSFAKEKHRKTYDYNEMSKKNPYLTEWVKDPVRASLANDELDKLKEVETRSRLLTFKHQDMTLGNAIKAGIKSNYINLEKSYYLAKLLNGIGDPDETANTIAEMNIALAKREEKLPQHYKDFREEYGKASATYSKTAKERKEIWEKNWEGDVLGNLADYLEKGGESASDLFDMLALMGKNPKSGAISASQSLINSFAPLIVGVGVSSAAAPITTAVGTTVGGAAGTLLPIPGGAATGAATGASLAGGATFLAASTATGVALETMLELEGFLADSGVDMANPESIKAAFNDEKLIKEMRGKALKKGLTTAVVDSLASLIGGKLIGKAKPTITGKIVGGVKAAGIEAVGEGAGEAAGRFAATGEADVGEALEEGWSSIFIGGGMGSVGYVYAKGKNLSRSLAQNPVKAAMQIKEMNDRVGEARQHAQGVDSLIEIVQESKLNSRDRDSMVELVGGSTEGASVYFQSDDWEAHWGDDAISKADELLPKGRGDLEKAKTEGSLIKVPLADYVTKFPEETSFAELNKLMRRDSESLSLQQAETIGANIPSLLKEVAKEARKEIQKRKQESDARKAVQDSVEGQLISQGIDSKEAKSLAKLRAAQVNTLAGIRGVSAIAQEAVRPLDIQAFTIEEFADFQKDKVVYQKDKVGLNLRKGEKSLLDENVEVSRVKMPIATKAKNLRNIPKTVITTANKQFVGKTINNLKSGIDLEITEKAINDFVSSASDKVKPTANKRTQAMRNRKFAASMTVLKNLGTLIQNAVPATQTKDGVTKYYAIGLSDKDESVLSIDVKNGKIESIKDISRTASPAASALASVQDDSVDTISISDLVERVNAGRDIADLQFQDEGKKARGFLDISKKDRLLLGLLEHKNKSTILHEFGHVFLEDVKTLYSDIKDGAKNETQKRFLADVETIKKELGVESLDDIQTEHHEKFARLFESYLLEGKAPSKELTSVFHRFKTWLINLYKNVKGVKEASGLDFNLTPDMREAFDRMLATEEEIAEASGEMGFDENQLSDYFDLITTNKEEKERLELAHREAQDEAFLELYRKQVAQMKKKKTAEYKSRKAVLKEQFTKIADETPLYIAQDAIKFHVLNGQEITSHETLKFNTDELKNYLTKEQLKKFPRSLYSKSGISPEVTATMLGFKSGKELVDLIVKNPDKKTFIEESTQIELNKEFPDYLDPNRDDELKADAIDSVNNDMRDKALRLELDLMIKNSPSEIKKLIKKNIKRLPTSKEVRREADNRIDDTLISEAKPHIFTRVENKARRESGQHMLNGQFEKLAKAKVSEMLNYQLSRSANEAQQLIDKTIKKNNKRLAVSDEKLRKKGNVDMYKVAQSILAKYGMLPDTRVESLSSYMKKLKDYNPEIHSMVDGLSSALVDIPATGNYSELTVGQFKEITEIVDALYNLSEKEKFVRVDGKKVDIDVAVSELAASIQDTGRKAVKKFDTGYKKFQGLLSSFYANNTRVEHFINWLDKNDPEGPWSRYVWNRINDAQTEYLQLREETTDKLNQILKNNFKGIFKDKTQIDLTKYFSNVDPDVAMIKKPELVMMLLHSGNDSNKRKLLLGRKLGAENLDGTLNTVEFDNFIKEMINEGHIDKTIMDGVQAIWDLYEALKPGLQKAYKDSFGTYFKEIEANPFSTPWGEYRGGYAPATTDSLLVEAEAERQDAVSIEAERNQFDYAATPKGMTKERIAAYNKALSLDFGITLAQMEKTVRFTTLQSAIGDVNRIINHRELSDVMFKADNNWNKGILKPWLARAATQRTAPVYSDYYTREAAKMTGFLRRSTNQAIMALNIKNTVENLTDITALFVHMDKKSWMEGVKQYSAQPREVTQMIMELDPSMKDRFSNNLYEVQDMYRDLVLNGTLLDDVAKWQKTASKYSYITQRTLQNFMEASAWIGAYNEGLVKFKDSPDPSKKAARNASRIIRLVMGSNRAIDIANVEAVSEFAKVFITFFSYFNNRANLIGYSTKDKRAKAIRLGWLAPAIIAELLRRVVWKGNIGDEEDEELVNYVDDGFEIFLGAPLEFALAAGSPTIRNGSRIIIGQFTKQQYDDRLSMSPLLGSVEAMKGVTNLIVKDKATGKDVRDALQFTSTVTGFPLNPLGKPVGFMLDLDQGKQKAENPIDYFRGITTGRSGKR